VALDHDGGYAPKPPLRADPELLADVLARPEDDAPRLVLADELTENGDPRGELIVVQVLLAQGGIAPPRRRELRLRSEALLAEHRAAWTANAEGATSFAMRRGFVDEIHADAEALRERAAALFASEPVTRLTLTNAGDSALADLASAGAFARVTRLTLRGPVGDAGTRVLAAALARRSTPLYSLNLGSCQIEASGAAALSSSLTGCRTLALTGNSIEDDGLRALATSKALAALETLYVSDNDLTDEGLQAVARGALGALTRLSVARNEGVTRAGLRALAKSKKLAKLRWLEYTDPEEGDQRVAARG
jgi:uncharacterized protein (TIGR02996 family)